MAKSMTGYGKAELVTDEKQIVVEIKSVNNRYLDVNTKIPRYMMFAEEKIKKLISEYTTRGKVDIFVNVMTKKDSGKKIILDKELVASYMGAFKELCDETGLLYDLSASRFLNNSDVVKMEIEEKSEDEIFAEISPVIEQALISYNKMREIEGERLKADIIQKTANILSNVEEIEKIVPLNIESYKEKLLNKIKEVSIISDIDENRIITEVALYVDKTCVDEETVRAKSHLKSIKEVLASDGAVGKKLDFIIQELNRETNTIGSKSNELKISELVINTKNEIEKIREQIQNLE